LVSANNVKDKGSLSLVPCVELTPSPLDTPPLGVGIGDGAPINPKAIDRDLVRRSLIGLMHIRSHPEGASRNLCHAVGRNSSHPGIILGIDSHDITLLAGSLLPRFAIWAVMQAFSYRLRTRHLHCQLGTLRAT
jgi:hypothetical protein